MKFALLFLCLLVPLVSAQLRAGFYKKTCPRAEAIVLQVVRQNFGSDRSITAALLRMHFHDCFVKGCDASILIDSTKKTSGEKDAGPNQTVRGYDLIDKIKKALEAACPNVVSCADVITLATRDSVALAGGLNYTVPTGRRDGLVADSSLVSLPGPSLTVSQAFTFFKAKGLTLNDMVTLLGAHTVGVAHCGFFQDRLSNFQGTKKPDPTMDSGLAKKLLNLCGTQSRPISQDPKTFLDQNNKSSFIVDNSFYNQIKLKRGVLKIDQELASDKTTSSAVNIFAKNSGGFKQSFAKAMVKLGKVEVLTGKAGQIRKNCRVFNKKKN